MIEERLELELVNDHEGSSGRMASGLHSSAPWPVDNSVCRVTTPSILLTAPEEDGSQVWELHPANSLIPKAKSPIGLSNISNSSLSNSSQGPVASLHRLQSPTKDPVTFLPASMSSSTSCVSTGPTVSVGTIIEEPLMEDGEDCVYNFHVNGDTSGGETSNLLALQDDNELEEEERGLKFEAMALFREHKAFKRDGWRHRSQSCPDSHIATEKVQLWDKMDYMPKISEEKNDKMSKNNMIGSRDAKLNIGNVSDVVIRAKQWRKQAQAAKDGSSTHDGKDKITFAEHVRKRALTEVPRALHLEILEESHSILQRTLKMYQSAMGASHPLVTKTEKKLQEVESQLGVDLNVYQQ